MKAPIAQAGGKVASPPGCAFFFLGPRNRKMHFKKTRISAGFRFKYAEYSTWQQNEPAVRSPRRA